MVLVLCMFFVVFSGFSMVFWLVYKKKQLLYMIYH